MKIIDKHVIGLCKWAGRKLSALKRLARILPLQKRRILIQSFFKSQFSYCPLIWMFINHGTNHRINRLQERSRQILYKDDISAFEELLQQDSSVTIHTLNIQILANEMYKVYNNKSPDFICQLFSKSNVTYNLRNVSDFERPTVNTVWWRTETVRNIGPQIWELIPSDIKTSPSLPSFKLKLKSWNPENCPCRVCKTFVPGVGFL